jgi:deazaflavin-dependent oxidoreductase (nitroreductase family)
MSALEDDVPESRSRLRAAVTSGAAGLVRKRWLVRAPIWLFRVRLGFVFGARLLLLEHTGRKTGARRYVVLEVIGRRPRTYLVPSAYGARAQWYRNVRANPSVRVCVGGRYRAAATARPLPADEAREVLDGYARRYPRAWAAFGPVLEDITGGPASDMPVIALELGQQA